MDSIIPPENNRPRNLKNLRNRPFLIVTMVTRPAKGVNTSKKGWHEKPGSVDIFERPYVKDRISDNDIAEASVVIDILNRTVVKNRYEAVPDAVAAAYYLDKYRDQVKKAMTVWHFNFHDRKKSATTDAQNDQKDEH